MSSASARPPAHRAPAAPGPLDLLLGLGFGLVGVTIFSWGIGIAIELVGIQLLWPEQGEEHSRAMVVEDLGYIAAAPRSLLVADTVAFAHEIVRLVEWPYHRLGLVAWYRRHHGAPAAQAAAGVQQPAVAAQPGMAAATESLAADLSRWVLISMYVAQDTLLRGAIALFAAPAFVLACLLGAVDGLVRRDLRRWGGARESSFVYHHAKRYTRWALTGGFTLYLSWPFGGFDPALMVLVFTALVAFSLSTTLASFKKYV
jgi:integrating conjugative element membrane protein (TIGR03747 family)